MHCGSVMGRYPGICAFALAVWVGWLSGAHSANASETGEHADVPPLIAARSYSTGLHDHRGQIADRSRN